jgi:hypothetical protein
MTAEAKNVKFHRQMKKLETSNRTPDQTTLPLVNSAVSDAPGTGLSDQFFESVNGMVGAGPDVHRGRQAFLQAFETGSVELAGRAARRPGTATTKDFAKHAVVPQKKRFCTGRGTTPDCSASDAPVDNRLSLTDGPTVPRARWLIN